MADMADTGAAKRVLLVDDHGLIREGLRRAFDRTSDLLVVAEAGNCKDAMQALQDVQLDVLVTDLGLPDGNGMDLVRFARAGNAKLGIVVLTMYSGDEQIVGAMEAGASAFVNKDASADEVVAAARHASIAPRSFTAHDLSSVMTRRMSAPAGPRLSPRETEVLALLVDGLAVGQISRRLFISESTTKTHVAKIYDKLGASNRAQAVISAVRLGLVSNEALHRPFT